MAIPDEAIQHPGDILRDQIGAMEASTLVLLGMFNKLSERMVAAGIADPAQLSVSFDELVANIENVPALRDNPEVKRRFPLMKSMMLGGIDGAAEANHE